MEGPRLIEQALQYGAQLSFLLVDPQAGHESLIMLAEEAGVEVWPTSPQLIRRVCQTRSPQGVVGVAQAMDERRIDYERAEWLVIADRLQDPGNLGTLMRTVAAVGVDGLVLTEGTVDPKNAKAVRASAGAYFQVPLHTGVDPSWLKECLREQEFRLVAADASGELDAFTFSWKGRLALVIGNEAEGPSPSFANADKLRLPMPGGGESLNAGVAAGALLYLALRDRLEVATE